MAEITRSPLCWPNNVARTAPQTRDWPLFQENTLASAFNFALQEINRLNGRKWDYADPSVIVSSNLRLNSDGSPTSKQAEPADPGVAIYFKLVFRRAGKIFERPCVLTCDKWRKVALNMDAIARDIEAQRARQRYGCTSVEQAFQGYLAIPERCGGRAWWDVLGMNSRATLIEVKDYFKALAKVHHPDVGGKPEKWNELREAYDQAIGALS